MGIAKFDCGNDIDGGDGDDKDDVYTDDGGDVGSNIGNDANCGDGKSKFDCSEDTAGNREELKGKSKLFNGGPRLNK